jgi:hypothetical protein
VDILIDSSVERVLIPNLIFSSIEAFQHASARYMFPIAIPKGSRLSAQCQAGAASAQGLYVNVILGQSGFAGKMPFGSKVTAYGANIGTTRGINIDPGGTANTPVTVEIDPSIDDEINGLVLGIGGAADFVKTTHTRWAVDIMGGAATEQILIPGILLLFGSAMDLVQPTASIFFPIRIAKGTRLAIRAQSTSITAVDRTFDAVIYGVH